MPFQSVPNWPHCNDLRHRLFKMTHEVDIWDNPLQVVGAFLGHKMVTAITFPLNTAAAIASLAGTAITACTVGAAKVALFAASRGNWEPEFSTGANVCAEVAEKTTWAVLCNIYELSMDASSIASGAIDGTRWTAQKLGLGGAFQAIAKKVREFGEVFLEEFEDETLRVREIDETWLGSSYGFDIKPLELLREKTEDIAPSSWRDEHRRFKELMMHKAVTLITIPSNIVVSAASAGLCLVGLATLVARSALYALSGIHIPLPNGQAHFFELAFASYDRVIDEVGENMADLGIVVYKISEMTGLLKTVASLKDVINYVPRAIW